jgi:hypothetical protein
MTEAMQNSSRVFVIMVEQIKIKINKSLLFIHGKVFKARSLWGRVFTPYILHTTFNIRFYNTQHSTHLDTPKDLRCRIVSLTCMVIALG